MNQYPRLIAIFLALFLAAKSHHVSATIVGYELVGRWNFVSASQTFPTECTKMHFDFRTNGKLHGSDGSRDETKRWIAIAVDHGFRLKLDFISDNGKPNCQGLSAEYVRKNSIQDVYVELLEDGKSLKMYFEPRKGVHYMLFRRGM